MSDGIWVTEQEFRDLTGFTTVEVSSSEISTFFLLSEKQIKVDGFRFRRGERANKDSYGRYFVNRIYFADGNLDNSVDVTDIRVWEYDYTTMDDISAQVDTIDVRRGFFTLKDGYPTSGKTVMADYHYASRPLEEIKDQLKLASLFYASYLVLKKIRNNNTKSGIVSYSIGDMSISKSQNDFDKQINEELGKYRAQIDYIKPVLLVGFTEGKQIEWREGLDKGRRITDRLSRSRYTRYGSIFGGVYG